MKRARPCVIIPADESIPMRLEWRVEELESLQAIVGGYIELVPMADYALRAMRHHLGALFGADLAGGCMFVHDSGRLLGLPLNRRAALLAGSDHAYDGLHGDAFVMRVS